MVQPNPLLKNLPIKAWLKIQDYPFRGPIMRLFTDGVCKKELATNFHREAFKKSLKENLESDS